MHGNYKKIITELNKFANPEKAKHSMRFFKTGRGQYGEGDTFIGLTVPEQRKVAKSFGDTSLIELKKLLNSPIHEHRLTALMIILEQFKKGESAIQTEIFNFYLENKKQVNNWDLVDLSAPNIVGAYLYDNQKKLSLLDRLVESSNLWDRRISIVSTYYFIRKGDLGLTFKLSKKLLLDKEDLIHKATGWMLREAGKKDEDSLKEFLNEYANQMPRTMLRYAIEKFDKETKARYLSIK